MLGFNTLPKHDYLPHFDAHKVVQDFPNCHRSHLHTRVDRGADRTTKGVPTHVVEPFEELFQTIIKQILCSSEIKPWIKFMDHLLFF